MIHKNIEFLFFPKLNINVFKKRFLKNVTHFVTYFRDDDDNDNDAHPIFSIFKGKIFNCI